MKKVPKESLKQKLLEKVPKLTFNEVRRRRVPLHEALAAELKDGQFENGSQLFNDFVQHDLQNSKALVRDFDLLERIYEVLKMAEYSSKEDEVEMLLKLANSIKNLQLFHWLVEKILLHAILLVGKYDLSGTRLDAVSKYLYGKFLADHRGMLKQGLLSLEKAFELSLKEEGWEFEIAFDIRVRVAQLAATTFCDVSLKLSRSLTIEDPEEALELAYIALRVIRENPGTVPDKNLEVEAEFEFASCFKEKHQEMKALHHLDHALELAKFAELHDHSFKTLVKMSECFAALKNDEKYEETLTAAKDLAKVHLDSTIQGDVLVKLAQYYVERNNLEKATDFYVKAIESFRESGERKKLRKVELMMAPVTGKLYLLISVFGSFKVSSAQKTFNNLVDTILKSDKAIPGHNKHLENLILWVDRQEPLPDVTEVEVDDFVKKFYDPDEPVRLDADL